MQFFTRWKRHSFTYVTKVDWNKPYVPGFVVKALSNKMDKSHSLPRGCYSLKVGEGVRATNKSQCSGQDECRGALRVELLLLSEVVK